MTRKHHGTFISIKAPKFVTNATVAGAPHYGSRSATRQRQSALLKRGRRIIRRGDPALTPGSRGRSARASWCKGAFAEYASAAENTLLPKPANLTFEQAAAVGDSAFTALAAVRDQGKVQPVHKVLINGASGGVGTFAVQIAKSFGANVTGVCSTRNVEMVRSLGADQVIDYTNEDFTQTEQAYDVMLDLVGTRSLSDCRRALTPRGTYVVVGVRDMGRWFGLGRQTKALLLSPFVRQRMRVFVVRHNPEDLAVLKELAQTGKITPVIDRRYSLSDVPEALQYQGEGHSQGKVIIAVSEAP